MGFPLDSSIAALGASNGDVEEAITFLLESGVQKQKKTETELERKGTCYY